MRKQSVEIDIKLLKAGEPKTVENWFLKFADAVYGFVLYRVGKDSDLATEVVQETFLTALKRIEQYDLKRGTMHSWLTFISKNCIKKALREKGKYKEYTEIWDRLDKRLLAVYERLATEPLPPEVLERKETSELVHMTLSSIPGNYKEVLRKHYFCGKSLREISELLQINEAAAKALLYRARLAFKTTFLSLAAAFDKI